MVYTNREDFNKFYGGFAITNHGYSTMYEAMGAFSDPRVSIGEHWGLYATHMHLQRYAFPPMMHTRFSRVL